MSPITQMSLREDANYSYLTTAFLFFFLSYFLSRTCVRVHLHTLDRHSRAWLTQSFCCIYLVPIPTERDMWFYDR